MRQVLGAVLLLCAFLGSCMEREPVPIHPCVQTTFSEKVRANRIERVDVLFVVDNSTSMRDEQDALAREFPRMVRVLASGDRDEDGIPDFPAVRDLHVGVVSTDMGTGPYPYPPTCPGGLGDDGVLVTEGNADVAACDAEYPAVLSFSSTTAENVDPVLVTSFGEDFACVAQLGTDGCGFEQQLEAPLKALTPSTSDLQFMDHTLGHGERENAGFLRDDSLLVVIVVTDEDDCSAADSRLFETPADGENINLRCALGRDYADALHPVSRYVNGLLALRAGAPELLIFASIAGVPPDLVSDREAIDHDGILDDPRMQFVPATDGRGLEPACGEAAPARRIVEVVRDLDLAGAGSVIQSICQEDFRPALDAIIAKMVETLRSTCVPRDLHRAADGKVGCRVLEVLPFGGEFQSCAELTQLGRVSLDPPLTDPETGMEICEIVQLAPTVVDGVATAAPSGFGWYYDDFTEAAIRTCGQRIAFTEGAEPLNRALFQLDCLEPIAPGAEPGEATMGSPCNPEAATDECAGSTAFGFPLGCEAQSRTCRIACTVDAECPAGLACDVTLATGLASTPVCVNPICH